MHVLMGPLLLNNRRVKSNALFGRDHFSFFDLHSIRSRRHAAIGRQSRHALKQRVHTLDILSVASKFPANHNHVHVQRVRAKASIRTNEQLRPIHLHHLE